VGERCCDAPAVRPLSPLCSHVGGGLWGNPHIRLQLIPGCWGRTRSGPPSPASLATAAAGERPKASADREVEGYRIERQGDSWLSRQGQVGGAPLGPTAEAPRLDPARRNVGPVGHGAETDPWRHGGVGWRVAGRGRRPFGRIAAGGGSRSVEPEGRSGGRAWGLSAGQPRPAAVGRPCAVVAGETMRVWLERPGPWQRLTSPTSETGHFRRATYCDGSWRVRHKMGREEGRQRAGRPRVPWPNQCGPLPPRPIVTTRHDRPQ